MRTLVTIFILICSTLSFAAEVKVNDSWVRAMPPGMGMTAGYLTLENTSEKKLILESISSTAADDCSIHRTEIKDGMSRMIEVHDLGINPHQILTMQPGGIHIMLMELTKPLKKGEKFPLQLNFSDGSKQIIEAVIESR
jgi:hypothetical protein